MDLILYNGTVHTMNGHEVVSAIAVENGFVADVGCDDDILALRTAGTEVIDLEKSLVVPGFNDSHMHILNYGLNKRRVNLTGCKSVSEVIERGRNYISKNPAAKMILGRGWNQDYFDGHVAPARKDLDEISKELPIVFYRVCGHSAVVNSKAIDVFGIDGNTVPPAGGSFDLQSGLFCEAALDFFQPSPLSVDEIKEILEDATSDMIKKGITSAQSDDFGFAAYENVMKAYSELSSDGKLPVRIYQQCLFDSVTDIMKFFANTRNFSAHDYFYKLGPMKILTDGSLGARTALLSRLYNDDDSTSGIACFTQTELDEIVSCCHENGKDMAIHCIGDGALRMAADSVEKAQKAFGKGPRHGIVHCQISDMPLLERLKELELLAYIQPIFLNYDIHIVEKRVGQELSKTSYNFKTMLDLGLNVSLGTDCPVEPFDPLNNIYCAVTRKDLNSFPEGGFCPEQVLSVYEAVYCYTSGSAYCSHEENIKGKLKKGFFADMAVIDKDILTVDFEEIKDARVKMTIVGGKVKTF